MGGHEVELVGGPLDGQRRVISDRSGAVVFNTLRNGEFGRLVYVLRDADAPGVLAYDWKADADATHA